MAAMDIKSRLATLCKHRQGLEWARAKREGDIKCEERFLGSHETLDHTLGGWVGGWRQKPRRQEPNLRSFCSSIAATFGNAARPT